MYNDIRYEFDNLKNVETVIKKMLELEVELGASDERLINYVHAFQLGSPIFYNVIDRKFFLAKPMSDFLSSISVLDYMKKRLAGELWSEEDISRKRRKIQKDNEKLRDANYQERQVKSKEVANFYREN